MSYKTYEVRVYDSGEKRWYLNGERHREDGPAYEGANGDKRWYLHDKLHREDGHAVEYGNGGKEWWLDGVQYTEAKWCDRVIYKNTCNGEVVEIKGQKYKLVKM